MFIGGRARVGHTYIINVHVTLFLLKMTVHTCTEEVKVLYQKLMIYMYNSCMYSQITRYGAFISEYLGQEGSMCLFQNIMCLNPSCA